MPMPVSTHDRLVRAVSDRSQLRDTLVRLNSRSRDHARNQDEDRYLAVTILIEKIEDDIDALTATIEGILDTMEVGA